MTEKIHILIPMYFDHWAAINTVHREVAKRLSGDFRVTAFTGNHSVNISRSHFDNLIEIPTSDCSFKRILKYISLYGSNFDLVQTWGARSDYLVILSKFRRAKVVHTMHTGGLKQMKKREFIRKRADKVIAVSKYVQQLDYNYPERANVDVIPNGIDLDLFHPSLATTEDGLISYVGKNSHSKHPELIFKIAKKVPNLRFAVLGPDFDPDVVSVDKPSNVVCKPALDRKEVAEQFSRSQIVLCPYEREAFCMTALESMAADTPTIGLAEGNLVYLITNVAGILCEDTNVDTWTDAIVDLRENYKDYNPRSEAKKYSWDNISAQYERVYRNLL